MQAASVNPAHGDIKQEYPQSYAESMNMLCLFKYSNLANGTFKDHI